MSDRTLASEGFEPWPAGPSYISPERPCFFFNARTMFAPYEERDTGRRSREQSRGFKRPLTISESDTTGRRWDGTQPVALLCSLTPASRIHCCAEIDGGQTLSFSEATLKRGNRTQTSVDLSGNGVDSRSECSVRS